MSNVADLSLTFPSLSINSIESKVKERQPLTYNLSPWEEKVNTLGNAILLDFKRTYSNPRAFLDNDENTKRYFTSRDDDTIDFLSQKDSAPSFDEKFENLQELLHKLDLPPVCRGLILSFIPDVMDNIDFQHMHDYYTLEKLLTFLKIRISWLKALGATSENNQAMRCFKSYLRLAIHQYFKVFNITVLDKKFLYSMKLGEFDIAMEYLDEGADINAFYLNNTALSMACSKFDLPEVQCLVERGTNLNMVVHGTETPLDIAINLKKMAIVRYLVGEGADYTLKTLINAVKVGNLPAVQCLVEYQPEIVNANDFQESTALMYAAASGYKAIVQYLVEQGADITKKDVRGLTAVKIAAYDYTAQSLEIVRYLNGCKSSSCCLV